jgi:peroxiredoxin
MKKSRIILLIFFIAILFTMDMCKNSTPTEPDPEPTPESGTDVGNIAVDFTAKDQNGNNVSLYDYSGKVILVDMSADWCGPCRNEATHLEDLYDEYRSQGFQIITILTSGDPKEWANEYKLSFPVLDDNDEDIWGQYGEEYWPLNMILDRDMVIKYKMAGYDETTIKDLIERYL